MVALSYRFAPVYTASSIMNRMYWFLIGIFLLVIFFLAFTPFEYDIWFHVKSGEIIAKQGIIFHDVFSHAAPDRMWYPYEWLYQIIVFWIQKFFGFAAIAWVTAGVSMILIATFLVLLIYVFSLPVGLSLVVGFSLFTLIYEFLSSRPHLPAGIFFLTELLMILAYVKKRKNILWLTVPVTIVWANMHASVVLAIYLFGAYATVALLAWVRTRNEEWFGRGRTLVLWTITTIIATLLPPLGTTQYRLLILFYQQRAIITRFLDEWLPLVLVSIDFVPFAGALTICFVSFIFVLVWRRRFWEAAWLLPLIPVVFTAFVAVRNLLWAYLAIAILFAWSLGELFAGRKLRIAGYGLCVVMVIVSLGLLWEKKKPQRMYVPEHAVAFLATHQLRGTMFNSIGVGGYILYHLYPRYRVFIDGRADVYLCCEIPDLVAFFDQKKLPDDAWKPKLDRLLSKYDVSFVLHSTARSTVSRRIGEALQRDPQWALVYWDDDFQILVKRDGKNDAIIGEFGVQAATPLNLPPYLPGNEDLALSEYRRMLGIADSARSRNAVAFILMQKGDFDTARGELSRAIAIQPLFDSPYMNLGELAVRDGDDREAIRLYEKALSFVRDRGFTYIRLGELYSESGNQDAARRVWEQGLQAPIDAKSKNILEKRLAL